MTQWTAVCAVDDLVPDRGSAALVDGHQIALFRLAGAGDIYAVDHRDPFSQAYVMARGLVGSRGETPTVASPMHKQTFDLRSGECLDDPQVRLSVWQVRVVAGVIEVCMGTQNAAA